MCCLRVLGKMFWFDIGDFEMVVKLISEVCGDDVFVGESVEKVDGWGFVIGKVCYIDDVLIDDVFVVKVFWSLYVYVCVWFIDIEVVEMIVGVKVVFIYEDVFEDCFM